ncbi:hypothetical protein AUR64_00685 [Haloprofundus marisrubri]|uniref:DUF83 domain-containing protein n=1 Tax=Haloprofundus marisrubri TaxID=1514971 RepID=A0A0W1R426_9EURY|nr:hypothetical protein [Haloprofundus marisrubri]KTG08126.1 hypothetical protein AUR64_00685 [Haloprofundus marisrubri]
MPTFTDLSQATYCPRQLYYARRDDDRGPPPEVAEIRKLAFRYGELVDAADETIRDLGVAVEPEAYRRALRDLRERDEWSKLCNPAECERLLRGKDARGIAHKVLTSGSDDDDPPIPTLVSPGQPPERGVWKPQKVRAVAAAKALSWEEEREIPQTLVEYPTVGAVRTVRLTTRAKAAYRTAVRTVQSMDGPPPRLRGSDKCSSCEYRTECGIKTRSLRSLFGL